MNNCIVQDIGLLRTFCQPVISVEEVNIIKDKIIPLFKDLPSAVGISAIQIGIPKTMSIVDLERAKKGTGYLFLINSKIIEKENEFIYPREGCLSFPNKYYDTKRYKDITIENYRVEETELVPETLYFYYDDENKLNNDGLLTIAVQHEIDHESGILIIDNSHQVIAEPLVKLDRKIGRNEPCYCNSGKKYKKCCGR